MISDETRARICVEVTALAIDLSNPHRTINEHELVGRILGIYIGVIEMTGRTPEDAMNHLKNVYATHTPKLQH